MATLVAVSTTEGVEVDASGLDALGEKQRQPGLESLNAVRHLVEGCVSPATFFPPGPSKRNGAWSEENTWNTPFSRLQVAACREARPEEGEGAVTLLPGVLLARYLGDSSEAVKRCFARLWSVLRPALLGREAVEPRIWRT